MIYMCRYCVAAWSMVLSALVAGYYCYVRYGLKAYVSMFFDFSLSLEERTQLMVNLPEFDPPWWLLVGVLMLLGGAGLSLPVMIVHFFRHLSDYEHHPWPRTYRLEREEVLGAIEMLLPSCRYRIDGDVNNWIVLSSDLGDSTEVALEAKFSFLATFSRWHGLVRVDYSKILAVFLKVRLEQDGTGKTRVIMDFDAPATAFYSNGRPVIRRTIKHIWHALDQLEQSKLT